MWCYCCLICLTNLSLNDGQLGCLVYLGSGLFQAMTLNESSIIDTATVESSAPPSTRRPKSVPAHLHSTPDNVRSLSFSPVLLCPLFFNLPPTERYFPSAWPSIPAVLWTVSVDSDFPCLCLFVIVCF